MRKLKYHEQKLLKKVDFLQWKSDQNIREIQVQLDELMTTPLPSTILAAELGKLLLYCAEYNYDTVVVQYSSVVVLLCGHRVVGSVVMLLCARVALFDPSPCRFLYGLVISSPVKCFKATKFRS